MKRVFSFVFVLVLLAAAAVPALADVAYTPQDNFYEKHWDACSYENRRWYTNGPEGYVLVYSSPTGAAEVVVPNGLPYTVSWTYDNGKWGCIEYDREDPTISAWGGKSGWIKMEEMTAAYDVQAFDEDHAAEYRETEPVALEVPPDGTIYGYKYPGSGIVVDKLAGEWVDGPLEFTTVFTDPAGRDWGYLGYYRGYRNFWICLDEPDNPRLEADENFKEAVTIPAATSAVMEAALKGARIPTAYLTAGAIGVVVIAAAVLFALIRKKKKA